MFNAIMSNANAPHEVWGAIRLTGPLGASIMADDQGYELCELGIRLRWWAKALDVDMHEICWDDLTDIEWERFKDTGWQHFKCEHGEVLMNARCRNFVCDKTNTVDLDWDDARIGSYLLEAVLR